MDRIRVWSDGTYQDAAEEPYPWMSDDYIEVEVPEGTTDLQALVEDLVGE